MKNMKARWMSLNPRTRTTVVTLSAAALVSLGGLGYAEGWFSGLFAKKAAPVAAVATPAPQLEIGPMPTVAEALQLQPTDRVIGQFGAPVTLIEYASLTCSHCADFKAETLPQVKRDWLDTGKAVFVFRELPWDNLALGMSALARCVPPAQYFTFTDMLFANQKRIVTSGNPLAEIKGVALAAGLNGEQVDACIANPELQKQVLRNKAVARDVLGVKGTPAFFVNGQQLEGAQPYKEMKAALQKAYDAATKK